MPFQKSGYSANYRQAAAVRLIIVMVTVIVVMLTVMVLPAMVLPFAVVTVMLMFVLMLVLVFMVVFIAVFIAALLYHHHPFPHLPPCIQFHLPGGTTFLDPNPETRPGASSIHPDYLAQGVPIKIPLQRLNHCRG